MITIGKKEAQLALGAPPRADLLPPAVGLAAKARSTRRALSVFVVGMRLATGLGYGAASFYAGKSQSQLDAETARTATLLASQAKYGEVRKVTSMLQIVSAARTTASTTSIDWKTYVASIQASLPAGTTVVTLTADSGTPMAAFAASTVPLQGARIAELTFEATSPSLPDVQAWLDGLAQLKGFVDAAPGSITLEEGVYKVAITMHISSDALWNQYAAKSTDTTKDSTGTDVATKVDTTTNVTTDDGGK